jgi:hypothetical protein
MARRIRRIGRRDYSPRRVAYRMIDGRKFYEPQPSAFPLWRSSLCSKLLLG